MMGALVVGILGGVGSGKSTVARLLSQARGAVLDADAEAHASLDERQIRSAIERRFGPCGPPDAPLNRSALARRVFGAGKDSDRKFLEDLVHPRVRSRLKDGLERLRTHQPPLDFVVIDAPLLLETGLDALCDTLIFVDAPIAQRRRQVAKTRGWSSQELENRESAQMPLADKRARADHIIENTSTLEALEARVETLRNILSVPLALRRKT